MLTLIIAYYPIFDCNDDDDDDEEEEEEEEEDTTTTNNNNLMIDLLFIVYIYCPLSVGI